VLLPLVLALKITKTSSTLVEHLPHHPTVMGSGPTGTGIENYKKVLRWVYTSSTVVECSTHNPKMIVRILPLALEAEMANFKFIKFVGCPLVALWSNTHLIALRRGFKSCHWYQEREWKIVSFIRLHWFASVAQWLNTHLITLR